MKNKQGADRFLTVFTLMSRVPVKRAFEADFSRADFWIPAISPIVSIAAIGGFAAGLALSGNLALAAAASIAVQYFCFNLFHFDGLVDTADAMLPAAPPERRLEILKDPRVGTYGFFCGALALGLRAGAIAVLAEGGVLFSALVAGLLAAPAAGRLACALVPLAAKPAKPTGLGALMGGFSKKRVAAGAALAFLPALAWSAAAGGWLLPALAIASALASGFGAALFVSKLYSAKVGGFTGDALGAAVELGEIAALLLLGVAVRFIGWLPA
ncbi:adenosylcobinamide-GDP ribazoletransferase [bacterium]|nr:adenosylcobinamide-GDP ribazoletransferase [bacterium]